MATTSPATIALISALAVSAVALATLNAYMPVKNAGALGSPASAYGGGAAMAIAMAPAPTPASSDVAAGTVDRSLGGAPVDAQAPLSLLPGGCAQAGNYLSSALLPKADAALDADWASWAPKPLTGTQFIDPIGYIGVDTVGSSLKNASYDLRSEPPNPRLVVSPWMNSSIQPTDFPRPSFEIGQGPQ